MLYEKTSVIKSLFNQEKYSSPKIEATILIFIFAVCYCFNTQFPIYIDDWNYGSLESENIISAIKEIAKFQYNHYFDWGGRCLVHTIAQIQLYIGRPWCDILNAAAYTMLVWCIYRIATIAGQRNALFLIIIHCYLWFLTPSLGESVFWKTGSANYLWGILIVILFIFFFIRYYLTDQGQYNKKRHYCLFWFFGIAAGWTNENTSAALVFFLIALIFLLKYEKREIPNWMFWATAGAITGTIILLAAPGNYVRYETIDSYNKEEPIYSYLFYRSISTIKQYLEFCIFPSIIYILSLVLYALAKKSFSLDIKLKISVLVFITSLTATAAMTAAPAFAERVWFGIIALQLTASMILIANLNYKNQKAITSLLAVTAISCMISIISYSLSYSKLSFTNQIWKKRDLIIEDKKREGEEHVLFKGYYTYPSNLLLRPIAPDLPFKDVEWMRNAYGRYMGIESVSTTAEFEITNLDSVR